MANGVTEALCQAVARVLAASANNLQLNMLLLEDDAGTPVRLVLPMKTRSYDPGDPLANPVEPAFARITAEKVYVGDESYTPVKLYFIGNLGDYQCNTEDDLNAILGVGGVAPAHPTLEEVTLATYDIPVESQQTYEDGFTAAWAAKLEIVDNTTQPA